MNNRSGSMNVVLRRIAVVTGIILLVISIKWSKDGYNFDVAGDSQWTSQAVLIGYALAVAGTVVQFVFSTNLRELNLSLIVFGLVAYGYSIYTNAEGIMLFQGASRNPVAAWALGFIMDGVPEPLIAWGLMESLSGDFVGNLFKAAGNFMTGKPINNGNGQTQPRDNKDDGDRKSRQDHSDNHGKQKGFERRQELEKMYMGKDRRQGGGFHRMEVEQDDSKSKNGRFE